MQMLVAEEPDGVYMGPDVDTDVPECGEGLVSGGGEICTYQVLMLNCYPGVCKVSIEE